jgi:hypothetical protein
MKVAINCKTHEESKRLMLHFDSIGLTCFSGNKASYLDVFDEFCENTCYLVSSKSVGHDQKTYFKSKGHNIITFIDYESILKLNGIEIPPLEKVEVTMQEIADKFNISVEQLKVKK